MRQAYFIRETKRATRILNKTYPDMLAALKHRKPKAKQLIEDEELSQLHDALLLLRLGHLRIEWCGEEKGAGRSLMLEVLERPSQK